MGSDHALDQVRYLMRIARAQAQAGEAEAAEATRAKAHAVAEARRAAPLAEPLPGNRAMLDAKGRALLQDEIAALGDDQGRAHLAEIAAALGDLDEARRLAAEIPNATLRRDAETAVPKAIAESGDIPAAIAEARRLDTPRARLEAFGQIIWTLATEAGVEDAVRWSIWP